MDITELKTNDCNQEVLNKLKEEKEVLPLEPDAVSVEEEPVPPFKVEVNALLDKLEEEGMQKVQESWRASVSPLTLNASNIFIKIMQDGAEQFKEKTGRNMTYAEMRRLYG
jgi:hypothetical protein